MGLVYVYAWFIVTLLAWGPATAQQYQYDNTGRLTAAIYPSGASINYEYDANSNITRIQYSSGVVDPVPPNGVIDTPAADVTIEAGQSVNFTGTGSDPDNATPLSFLWNFDGGAANSSAEDPGDVTFATAGTYTVTFTVTDADNLADPTPDSVVVTVNNVPAAGGGSSGSSSGGGGAVFLLPILCILVLVARKSRSLIFFALLLAGGAQAQEWTEMTSGTEENLQDVWMQSASLAYAVGDNGTVLRFDGADWIALDVGTTAQLNSVWGTSADDVWIVGASGTVLHYDGSNWTPVDIGAGTLPLNDVWTVGEIVYVVGGRGVWRMESGTWTRQAVKVSATSSTLEPAHNMSAIRGSDSFVVMTANNSFGQDEGLFVSETPFVNFDWVGLSGFHLDALWVHSDTFMLAVGNSAKRLNGGLATGRSSADWENYSVGLEGYAVWGTSPSSIWVAGQIGTSGRIHFGDGTSSDAWTPQLTVSFRQFRGLHGIDDQTLIAVGTLGTIYAFFGEPPEPPTPTSSNFFFSFNNDDGVNTLTGELTRSETDFVIPRQLSAVFERYFAGALSNTSLLPRPFGDNWSHSYNWVIDTSAGPDRIKVLDYRGTEYLFEDGGSGYDLVSPGWANVGLVDTGSEFIFYDRETSQRAIFDPATGRLVEVKDRAGNSLIMNYDTDGNLANVSDTQGPILNLAYDANGNIINVSVAGATTLNRSYSYNAQGLLAATTSPAGESTEYGYDANGFFVSATRAAGTANAVTRYTYEYQDGKVAASTLTGGGRTEYAYDAVTNGTTVSQPDGKTRVYSYDGSGRIERLQSAEGVVDRYTYDGVGRLETWTDGAGRVTSYAYDDVGNRISSTTDAAGSLTVYSYRSRNLPDGVTFHDIEHIEHPDGGLTRFRYDANGNLIQIEDPEGNFTDFTYDDNGNILTRKNALGGLSTFIYNERGQVVSHTDPNGNETTYTYDQIGRLTGVTNANGTTSMTYGNLGVPESINDPSGANHNFSYNPWGGLERVDRSDGSFTNILYDAAGNLQSVNRSDELTLSAAYNLSGLMQSLSRNGDQLARLAYDSDGRPTSVADGENRVWQLEYGQDGLITAMVRPDGQRIEIDRSADPRGLLSAITRDGEAVRVDYDAVGNVIRITDPEERQLEIGRDLNGQPIQAAFQPGSEQRTFTRDALGNWTEFVDPAGNRHTRSYGADGLLETRTDAVGNTTAIARDASNRVKTISYSDGLDITVSYGKNGLPSQVVGSDGSEMNIDTTVEGRLIGGTNLMLNSTDTGVTESNGIVASRDGQGRVSRLTHPSGFFVDMLYNNSGEVINITDSAGGETAIVRDEFGRPESITTPDGRVTTYTRDSGQRMTGIDIAGLGSISINRSMSGRIDSRTSTLPVEPELTDEVRNFSFNAASQKISATYDARGNLLSDGMLSVAWDAFNRITGLSNDTESTTYELDIFDRPVMESADSSTRVFVNNYIFGRPVISVEEDGTGNVIWNYVHTPDGRPLYRINENGERQYFHFDESGNTVLITDEAGNVLNAYHYAPHGEVIARNESVENFLTTGGELGAFEMRDKRTVSLGGRYVDTKSGHLLADKPIEARASLRWRLNAAPPNAGRSTNFFRATYEEFDPQDVLGQLAGSAANDCSTGGLSGANGSNRAASRLTFGDINYVASDSYIIHGVSLSLRSAQELASISLGDEEPYTPGGKASLPQSGGFGALADYDLGAGIGYMPSFGTTGIRHSSGFVDDFGLGSVGLNGNCINDCCSTNSVSTQLGFGEFQALLPVLSMADADAAYDAFTSGAVAPRTRNDRRNPVDPTETFATFLRMLMRAYLLELANPAPPPEPPPSILRETSPLLVLL